MKTDAERAREGCPTCRGRRFTTELIRGGPVDSTPCPECARVTALLAKVREEERERCAMIAENEWKDAMLSLLDTLGAESWPYVDNTPKEVGKAIWDHVRWLGERERENGMRNEAERKGE